ncbi:chemotaxis protein CheW [Fredinandcohnia sp. QZ13]|uniref:chemotaxis protein CheW n=1 Tax=Fredinandcohnia sp. QZ13 TaxID=3073144 RepID=UPI0028533CA9|nr:chemotaxis protein CheW [Fredinandcohnia sp. QZ13]MDR4886277.1 chemotaxis protein CheW [Fredinandcohnia sp. QZ13]
MQKYVIIQVDKGDFALPIHGVLSIEKAIMPTILPQAPEYMRGIVKIREEVVPVIDMKQLLFSNQSILSETLKYILVKTDDIHICLLVNHSKEILEVSDDDIVPFNHMETSKNSLERIIKLDEQLIPIINITRLFNQLSNLKVIREQVEKLF